MKNTQRERPVDRWLELARTKLARAKSKPFNFKADFVEQFFRSLLEELKFFLGQGCLSGVLHTFPNVQNLVAVRKIIRHLFAEYFFNVCRVKVLYFSIGNKISNERKGARLVS